MNKALLISLVAFTNVMSWAQCGTLDESFGEEGLVSTEFGSYKSAIKALALQPDGKIIAAGSAYNNGAYHRFAVARYHTDGSLDESFATNGKLVGNYPDEKMTIESVCIQPDGKIIGVGIIYNNYYNSEFFMVRLLPNGDMDTSFGFQGLISIGGATVNAVRVQPDGKIVAAGFRYFDNNTRDMVVYRFNANGVLDAGFGNSGVYQTSIGARDFATSLCIQNDGKILVGGTIFNASYSDFCLLRLLPDGSRDMTFGLEGIASFDYGHNDEVTSVCVQPDGKIIFSGFTGDEDNNYQFALMRINANGSIDHGFGNDGFLTGEGGSLGRTVDLEADGRIVIAGAWDSDNGKAAAIRRFLADGSDDETFGEDGLMLVSPTSSCQANAMVLQPDQKIVLGGEVASGGMGYNPDFALMRLHSGPPLAVGEQHAVRFTVYPNPMENQISVVLAETAAKCDISILDLHGRMVYDFGMQDTGLGSTVRLALPELSRGAYLLRIATPTHTEVVRVVK